LDSFNENFIDGFNATTSPALIDPLGEISKAYFDAISNDLFNKEMNEKCSKTIVYTAMHGVGANYIDQAVAAAGFKPLVHVQEQRGKPGSGVCCCDCAAYVR
jgi:phosphomannomutase